MQDFEKEAKLIQCKSVSIDLKFHRNWTNPSKLEWLQVLFPQKGEEKEGGSLTRECIWKGLQ